MKKTSSLNKFTKAAFAIVTSLSVLNMSVASGQTTYTIQPGDRLSEIAANYNVTIEDLRTWNNITGTQLEVGAQIYVSDPNQDTADDSQEENLVQTQTPPAQDGVYVVQSGDNLSSIADRYGVTVGELMAWNGLSSDWLNVGDQLSIAGGPVASPQSQTQAPQAGGSTYTVAPGDTLSHIAIVYGTSVDELLALNGGSDYLIAGQTINVPGSPVYESSSASSTNYSTNSNGNYTVQSGDSLSSIAYAYGLSVDELMALNGLSSDWLNVGDVLYVPGSSTPSTSSQTSPQPATSHPPQSQDKIKERNKKRVKPTNFNNKERDPNRRLQKNPYERLAERNRPKVHKVKEGETVWSIGENFNVSGRSIILWNGLEDENDLVVGEEIHVANPALVPMVADLEDGQDLETVAREFDTTVDNLIKWNQLTDEEKNDLKEGDLLIASDPEPVLHQTKPGEKLEDIAKKYKVEVKDLREWNYTPENVSIVNGSLVVSNPNGKDKPQVDQATDDTSNQNQTSQEESNQ